MKRLTFLISILPWMIFGDFIDDASNICFVKDYLDIDRNKYYLIADLEKIKKDLDLQIKQEMISINECEVYTDLWFYHIGRSQALSYVLHAVEEIINLECGIQ